MKLKELHTVLYSTRDGIQLAIVYDSAKNEDISRGSVEYVVRMYGEREVKRIEAYDDDLVITI